MLLLGYLLLFLCVVVVYIHVMNYYKTNDEIDYVELYEPLKTDYEKICKNKIPFTVLFENNEHFNEGKNALAPPLLYKINKNKIFINQVFDGKYCSIYKNCNYKKPEFIFL